MSSWSSPFPESMWMSGFHCAYRLIDIYRSAKLSLVAMPYSTTGNVWLNKGLGISEIIALLEQAKLWQTDHWTGREYVEAMVWSASFSTPSVENATELRCTMTLTAAPESAGQPGYPVMSIINLSPSVMFNSSSLCLWDNIERLWIPSSGSWCNGELLAILL